MTYSCPHCNKTIAQDNPDMEQIEFPIVAVGKAVLSLALNRAPRVRCECGKLVILLKGSAI